MKIKIYFFILPAFSTMNGFEKLEEHLAESFFDVRQGLQVLAEKSLISVSSGYIRMHNLLAHLGREIVRKQSIHDPGQRQFLVDTRDIFEVLNNDTLVSFHFCHPLQNLINLINFTYLYASLNSFSG